MQVLPAALVRLVPLRLAQWVLWQRPIQNAELIKPKTDNTVPEYMASTCLSKCNSAASTDQLIAMSLQQHQTYTS